MHPKISGSPDIILTDKKAAIFTHGCFWHKCRRHYRSPLSNKKYWDDKIKKNVKRDKENIAKLKKAGFTPSYIIDGGAARGSWTKEVKICYPESHYILVEPLEEHYPALEAISGAELVRGALGEKNGTATLQVHDEYNSSITLDTPSEVQRTIPSYTLESILEGKENVLLKLDLEGAEVQVLRHASLIGVEAIILECAFNSYFKTHVLYDEEVHLMKEKGFVLHDMFSISYDSKTGMLMQADILFVRKNSPLHTLTKGR